MIIVRSGILRKRELNAVVSMVSRIHRDYCTLGFNSAPSVTCDMPFRLENSDKGNFGCDKVQNSAPKSRFGPFFTHILAQFWDILKIVTLLLFGT